MSLVDIRTCIYTYYEFVSEAEEEEKCREKEKKKKKMFVREKRDMREKQICRVFFLFTEACTKSTDYQGTEITMLFGNNLRARLFIFLE